MEDRAAPRPVASDALLASEILAALETLSETRVRAFDFSSETRTEPLTFLSSTSRQTSSTFSCELASDLCGFLQEDPIAQSAGQLFAYVVSDPISAKDPFGLFLINPSCKESPFNGPVQAGVLDMCGRLKPGSPCMRALRGISAAMTGDANTIPDCFRRRCSDQTVAINCDPKCPYCGTSSLARGIVIGPGNPGCPNQPPNAANRYQGGPHGEPIGLGETIFHETFHICGTAAEPYDTGPLASYFRYAEAACYGWRDPNAPAHGPPVPH